jgi:hypothetical protein
MANNKADKMSKKKDYYVTDEAKIKYGKDKCKSEYTRCLAYHSNINQQLNKAKKEWDI